MKHKKVKTRILLWIVFFVTSSLSYSVVSRASSYTLASWYSYNSGLVGYWDVNPNVFIRNLSSSMSTQGYVNSAVSKWNAAGIVSSVTTAQSNANINFYGGTRSELIASGFYYDSSILGLTYWDNSTLVAYANGTSYSIYRLSAVSSSVCAEASNPENVALHEYGHVMGWHGHSPNGNDVMYEYENLANALTTNDKAQLTQIYNLMR